MRRQTVRSLRAGGYEVLVASGGEEALAALSAHAGPIDMVVSDVVMPGMDGARLARLVRERRPSVPVLFVSGHAHDVLAQHGVKSDGGHLLVKPFTASSLLAKVREVLDGARPSNPGDAS